MGIEVILNYPVNGKPVEEEGWDDNTELRFMSPALFRRGVEEARTGWRMSRGSGV